jgi:hypothetical protein
MIKQIIIILISMAAGIFSASGNNNILTVNTTGTGQPMILIHGMSCRADVWEEVADHYKSRYEVHLVTIAGFGNPESIVPQGLMCFTKLPGKQHP